MAAPPAVAITSANGDVQLPYPPTTNAMITITASKNGYVPTCTYWHRNFPSDRAPDHFSLTLEKAITIGGRVLGLDNRPLPNATVFINARKKYSPTVMMVGEQFATTNANGEWTLNTIPATCDYIAIGASHPLCLSGDGFINTEPSPILSPKFDTALFAQLCDRTHALQLNRGTSITGIIRSPDGKPVKASLTVGYLNAAINGVPDIATADDGHFQIAARPNSHIIILARASGFASTPAIIDLKDTPITADVTLGVTRPITLHIQDAQGVPIPNATFAIDHWEEATRRMYVRDIRTTLISDAGGNITWTEAPDLKMTAAVAAPGYMTNQNVPLTSRAANIVTLFPRPLIHVTAISAATGKPVADAHITEGLCNSMGNTIQWLDDADLQPGRIRHLPDNSILFSEDTQFSSIAVRAGGNHYAPTDSDPLSLDGHDYTVTLPLAEGERLTGQLIDSTGASLANIPIHLHTNWLDIYNTQLSGDAEFRKIEPAHFSTTDAAGNFSFPPQSSPYLLLAATDTGYVVVDNKQFEQSNTLTLQPFATIQGTLFDRNFPARAGIRIDADTMLDNNNGLGPAAHFSTTTDSTGHFAFSRVFAGDYTFNIDAGRVQTSKYMLHLKLRPGQTKSITLELPSP